MDTNRPAFSWFKPAAAAALLAASPWSLAANGIFTTEAAFVSAAGNTSIESFEALAGTTRGLAPIATAAFTISTAGAPMGVQTGADTPNAGFGGAATDGTHWVSVYLANQGQGSITFSFSTPMLSFGLNISDVGEVAGTVQLATNAGAFAAGATLLSYPPTVANGAISFIGLTQDVPFTSITLSVSGIDEAYGLDKVYTAAVPEPATALSLLAGVAMLGALARRKSA